MDVTRVKRALISVSDKTGLLNFAQQLQKLKIDIFSTGGTRKFLQDEGLVVHDVAEYTEFPEMMDGRLKTLHPKIFGGILCRHDKLADMEALDEFNILSFELVVVNLYPFEATVAQPRVTLEEAVEKIDIGGPSLVRAAAKNHAFTTIVTNPAQYAAVAEQLNENRGTSLALRRRLALAAFQHTAAYDAAIAGFFGPKFSEDVFPATLNMSFRLQQNLRYGENPHQAAAFYVESRPRGASLATAEQLNGKELSYNNLLDADSALALVRALPDAAAAVIKHSNPCGAASSLHQAFLNAYQGDPLSAFGGIVACNQTVDAETAAAMAEPGRFLEVIVAPDFSPEAVDILKTKPTWGANVRLVRVGPLAQTPTGWDFRRIQGGLLVQDCDNQADPEQTWQVVTTQQPSPQQQGDLQFAWEVVRHVKSNAIVLVKDRSLLGAGAGQMSRVDSVEIAIKKAGPRGSGSVLASDAFFPFADSIHAAAAAGVSAIIQPGGSKRDPEVIAAANQHGLPMIFTSRRHFRH